MSKDKILMCPPDFFTVEYVINPWMAGHEETLSLERAREQWDELRNKLGEFADIVIMDAQPELPDMVFTANAGVVYGDRFGDVVGPRFHLLACVHKNISLGKVYDVRWFGLPGVGAYPRRKKKPHISR